MLPSGASPLTVQVNYRKQDLLTCAANNFLFTSESVSEGHPDKMADAISDAVVDAVLAQDKRARIAAETLVKTGVAIVAGELTTTA